MTSLLQDTRAGVVLGGMYQIVVSAQDLSHFLEVLKNPVCMKSLQERLLAIFCLVVAALSFFPVDALPSSVKRQLSLEYCCRYGRKEPIQMNSGALTISGALGGTATSH
jgi:hypothetical protein